MHRDLSEPCKSFKIKLLPMKPNPPVTRIFITKALVAD